MQTKRHTDTDTLIAILRTVANARQTEDQLTTKTASIASQASGCRCEFVCKQGQVVVYTESITGGKSTWTDARTCSAVVTTDR